MQKAWFFESNNTEIMHTNKVFLRTTKAEREGAKLSNNLMRMLSLIDGKSTSGELSKRAPPSLRKIWNELLNDLVAGGYIIVNPDASIGRNSTPRESSPVQKKQETVRAQTEQPPPAAIQPTLDPEAQQKADKAARAAELKAYFAAAKEKAKAEKEAAAAKKIKHLKVEDIAAQRAVNTKDYLVKEKGIDASRISVATGTTDGQSVEDYLVPAGATFSVSVTPVDESAVTAQARKPLPVAQKKSVARKGKKSAAKTAK